MSEVVGNFWPQAIYEAHFKTVLHPDQQATGAPMGQAMGVGQARGWRLKGRLEEGRGSACA
eukprot:3471688-Alexandrium_andersonii.AAC.1